MSVGAFIRKRNRIRFIRSEIRDAARHAGSDTNPLTTNIIVSLTSFPARFKYLNLVIESIIYQSLRPTKVVLYLDEGHGRLLPDKVERLRRDGLDIRSCPPIRSYAKLVYALADFPNESIVTVDDDVIYPRNLLATLAQGATETPNSIIGHRCHRISRSVQGALLPYNSWAQDVQDDVARSPSVDLLPTGVGGVLYPPNSLDPEVRNVALARELCPEADDIWFYWMARRKGTLHRKVGGKTRLLMTPGSQKVGLRHTNVDEAGNDVQIRQIFNLLGPPPGFDATLSDLPTKLN